MPMLNRRAFLAGLPLATLAACSGTSIVAPPELVAAKAFRSDGPPALTLYTMRNVASGSGEHTALLIDASQRVMWDPAGSFRHSTIPEVNDVLFGFSPQVEDYYVSYHARETFFVVGQSVQVSADVAERALQLARGYGPVGQAGCARSTSAILRQLPGFGTVPQTWFPNTLMDAFGEIPGVVTREVRENDADNKELALAEIDMQITARQTSAPAPR